ncbi:MAG TPA: TIGR04282 family arsenosugar biosynthesis glycosyltransferase [Micropruina sp.]|nr:TIGR04282 family arsenosugar biosynthesis glycosyltransferase [Micropruina sp.]
MTTLVVVAKEAVPGRVKTRLHPPYSLEQAATLAQACLLDTLDVGEVLPATRRILLIEGRGPGRPGWQEWQQPSGGLDERLAWCLDQLSGPMLLVGMDTPHLDPAGLRPAFDWPEHVDAFLGPADDGGFWAIGLRRPDGSLVRGVPMSRDDTGAMQLRRLTGAGLRVHLLPSMRDIDTAPDLVPAAGRAPRLAAALAGCGAPR